MMLFLDLSKAFDTVDRVILVNRLKIFGLSVNVVSWSSNYFLSKKKPRNVLVLSDA